MFLNRISSSLKYLSTLTIFVLFCYKISTSFSSSKINVVINNLLCHEYKKEVIKKLQESVLDHQNANGLYHLLNPDYPSIKSISKNYYCNGNTNLFIDIHRPLIRFISLSSEKITNEYILISDVEKSNSCKFIHSTFYDQECLNGINTIYLNNNLFSISSELYESILKIPNALYDNYYIIWNNKNHIELIKKNEVPNIHLVRPNDIICNTLKCDTLKILTNIPTILNKSLIDNAEKIFKNKKCFYTKGMKADIRFRDFILCVPLQKEDS